MTISLGWFIVLCIFGFVGFIAAMWIMYLIGAVIGDIIRNYKKYEDYYLEHKKEEFLKTLSEQQDSDIEEAENDICNTCKLNQQCPLEHKPSLQCPYNDFEKR